MAYINAIDDIVYPHPIEGRLTLTSGDPETYTDVTDATTIYYEPYIGDRISLYNTTLSRWENLQFSQISIAVPATTNTNYDMYIYNNAGTITLEAVAWTDDTTRAVALAYLEGMRVKSTETNKLFIGGFRTTGNSGCVSDNPAFRFLCNQYNRIMKRMYKAFNAATWTYGVVGTWRQCNGSTTNQLEAFLPQGEENIFYIWFMLTYVTGLAPNGFCGIGANSTTSNSASCNAGENSTSTGKNGRYAQYIGPQSGYRYFTAMERTGPTGSGNGKFERDSNTYSVGSMNGMVGI